MNISGIVIMLEENGLTEVSEILSLSDHSVIEFFYDFDIDELKAARAYANEESDAEEDSIEWKREYYIPYLLDIAKDNSEAIVEEAMDEFELEWKLEDSTLDANENKYLRFVLACAKEEYIGDLEELLNDYL
ncbi:hypothetical protein [Clostridium chrysemydis]|uniref:hypothetical protein n=1 Tax=Clostridium chrysemydis TaxID=2665504 RepID=UPI00188384F8|nr:hypothetical protein [Clostridium chrysemydis]